MNIQWWSCLFFNRYQRDESAVLCMRSSFTAAPPSAAGSRSRKIPGIFALPPVDWTAELGESQVGGSATRSRIDPGLTTPDL
jgi:hypothetical protein